jgi:hypothetical protein
LGVGTLTLALVTLSPAAAQEPRLGGLKLRFLDVAGFTLSEPKRFPNPKHGYFVSYRAKQDLVVNVYVYNSTSERIPDGASSEIVKEESGLVEEGLKEAKRQGAYKSYAERASGEAKVGNSPRAPTAQRRLFEIERADVGRVLTDVYITGYKNHFVKIRITYPVGRRVEAEKAFAPVLEALGRMLGSCSSGRGEGPPKVSC